MVIEVSSVISYRLVGLGSIGQTFTGSMMPFIWLSGHLPW